MNINKIILQIFLAIITFLIINIIAYTSFSEKIRKYFVNYAVDYYELSRGYPRFHFKSDTELGFDINENFKTSTSRNPISYGSYDVWGNSYGCYDREWKKEDLNHENVIYLAGDSVTWGYVKHEKKFGTILEKKFEYPVLKCGVTHTGQRHQFLKFKRLFEKYEIQPKIVLVTIVANDIKNDYFFPHSTVIDGYHVENIEICNKKNSYTWKRLPKEKLLKEYYDLKNRKFSLRNFLREYSFSATIIAKLTEKIRHSKIITTNSNEKCYRKLVKYNQLNYKEEDYANSKISSNNRKAILDWSKHAQKNNYKLILSFFPHDDNFRIGISNNMIKFYKKHQSIKVLDFPKYVKDNKIVRSNLYHPEGHFNEFGELVYSQFLEKKLKKFF